MALSLNQMGLDRIAGQGLVRAIAASGATRPHGRGFIEQNPY